MGGEAWSERARVHPARLAGWLQRQLGSAGFGFGFRLASLTLSAGFGLRLSIGFWLRLDFGLILARF